MTIVFTSIQLKIFRWKTSDRQINGLISEIEGYPPKGRPSINKTCIFLKVVEHVEPYQQLNMIFNCYNRVEWFLVNVFQAHDIFGHDSPCSWFSKPGPSKITNSGK